MPNGAREPTAKGRSNHLFTALLAVVFALSLLSNTETNAQTSTESALAIPALAAEATAHGVVLTWDAVPDAARYELLAWWDPGINWQPLGGANLTGTTYTHTDVTAGTKYFYSIRAVNAAGETSAWLLDYASATALAATGAGTSTPTPSPTATAAPGTSTPTPTASALAIPALSAQATSGGVVLTWQAVPHAVRYELLTWGDKGTGWQGIGGNNLTDTTYTHTDVTAGTTYFYSIRAVNAAGEMSAWLLDYASATALAATGPGTSTPTPSPTATAAPGTLTPTPTATPDASLSVPAIPALSVAATARGVILTWPSVAGAVRYELLTWWDAGIGWQQIAGNNLTGTTYTHTEVTGGTTYFYSIRALNAFGAASGWLLEYATVTALAVTEDGMATFTPTPATTERGALIAFYEATNGEHWRHKDNWLTDAPLDSWYGVTADRIGRVSRLELRGNRLNGYIPDLSALTSLWKLDLAYNSFPGPFPELSTLTNLAQLDLQGNELTGPIPDLSAYSNLRDLSLGNNFLTGPIPDKDALPNLKSLRLNHNRLTGSIPPGLEDLPNLDSLFLAGNSLSGCIPASLQNVRSGDLGSLGLPFCAAHTPTPGPTPTPATTERGALVALYEAMDGANWPYQNNWLSNRPVGLWYGVTTDGRGRVTELDLRYNSLSGNVPNLSALTNLQRLWLAGNGLTGPIPNIHSLTNLRELDLSHNRFSGTIPTFATLSNLKTLDLYANRLTGGIPDLSNLYSLESLILGSNRLTGQIPDLSNLTSLTNLHLANNQFSGQIPDLSALTNLRILAIGSSQLTGPFPDLSALTNLTDLSLSGNRLSGPIPSLSALRNLEHLSLTSNQLTGQIPDLSALTKLRNLWLEDNQFNGQIPDLSALTNLKSLNLTNNQLIGQIPDLSALTHMTHLELAENQLRGPIPDLSTLTNLVFLDLADNQLTGPILNLHLLSNLAYVYLENNLLTGPIPDLSQLSNLRGLNLRGNTLCLPTGASLSHSNTRVAAHLNGLNPPTCTAADLSTPLGAPQNLVANVSDGQVMLTWDAVGNAVSYELRTWDNFDRQWYSIGGELTSAEYTHTVQTDGRSYYYQVRARSAQNSLSAWSEPIIVVVLPTKFPPPPISLGIDLDYQKYFEVDGLVAIAPIDVTDERMVEVRAIISGMLSNRADLLEAMAYYNTRIYIDDDNDPLAFRFETSTAEWWGANLPENEPDCYVTIHEFAHVIHFALEDQADGEEFNSKLQDLLDAALTSGLWNDEYASTNIAEYWAETVTFWLKGSVELRETGGTTRLENYDPEAFKLIQETLGDATVPSSCKR